MNQRPLAIVTSDPGVEQAARQAALLASDTVGPVRLYKDRETFEQVAHRLEGLVLLDPAVFAPASVHEWTLGFLRESHTLVMLFTRGLQSDADALARFVGAQGAVSLPIDPQELADRLSNPFGRRDSFEPAPTEIETSDLAVNLENMLQGKPGGERDRFMQQVIDPETGLFKATLWEHRFEEEYKRAMRFRFPIGLVAFSFDGEADAVTLLEVAGVILTDTRDVDIVGRLDANTFVALLPHTGPGGTEHFALRVLGGLKQPRFKDLLGEELDWSIATAVGPDASLASAEAFLRKVLADLNPMPA